VVLLGELTTLPFYNSSADASQAITAQINFTNTLSSQLYALDQNIFNSNSGQALLNVLNTLNLYINSYLLTPNYPYRNALTLITNQLVPSFNAFITSTLLNYTSNFSSPASRTAVLICLAVLCLAFFVLLWIISFRQGMRRREVAEILKFIDNDDL
jgi:predicted PurR-regulated permease PerM